MNAGSFYSLSEDLLGSGDFVIDDGEIQSAAGPVRYQSYRTYKLRLSQHSSLLLLEGWTIQQIFGPSRLLGPDREVISPGPFFYLVGEISEPWSVPGILKDVVFSQPLSVPVGLDWIGVRGLLLAPFLSG